MNSQSFPTFDAGACRGVKTWIPRVEGIYLSILPSLALVRRDVAARCGSCTHPLLTANSPGIRAASLNLQRRPMVRQERWRSPEPSKVSASTLRS